MQSQFLAAINQLCDEKGIPKEKVIETIKAALRAAYRKDYGNRDQNIDVDLDEKTIYINQIQAGTTDAGSMTNNWQRDALNRLDYRQLLYDMVYELALTQGFKKIAIRRASAFRWKEVKKRPEVAHRNYDGFAMKNEHVILPLRTRVKETFTFDGSRKRRKRDYLFRSVPDIGIVRKKNASQQ